MDVALHGRMVQIEIGGVQPFMHEYRKCTPVLKPPQLTMTIKLKLIRSFGSSSLQTAAGSFPL